MKTSKSFFEGTYNDLRMAALAAALLLYGVAGTPTPEQFGLVEIIVGALLVLAVGPSGFQGVFLPAAPDLLQRSGQILFFYGLSLPVVMGLVQGNNLSWALRDVIPFLFMLLPLFLSDLVRQSARYQRLLMAVIVISGLAFALRAVLPIWGVLTPDQSVAFISHVDPYYLVNAPTVLFAALFLIGRGGEQLYQAALGRHILIACAFIALALLPLAAMGWVMQRASLGVIALALGFWMVLAVAKAPRRALVPLVVVGGVLLWFWPVLMQAALIVNEKTLAVGMNNRGREIMAVLDLLTAHPLAFLLGQGWGAGLSSPAVGDLHVNFTHSLLSAYALKTGMVGLALVLVYMAAIAGRLWRLLWQNPVMAVALAAPFVIDVILYASFKSLDFGMILLLIAVLHRRVDSAT